MAKQRYINTKFWSDNWISGLDPLERYLFLYFLTNEHTNIAGIYELPLRTMAFETGIDKEMLEKMLPRFEGKVYYEGGWVYIKNFLRHQTDSESIRKGINATLSETPKKVLEMFNRHDPSIPIEVPKKLSEVPDGLRKKILNRDGFICQICKLKFEANLLEIDHIKRRTDGGTHIESNLRVLCTKCHRERHKETPPDTVSDRPTYLNLNVDLNSNSSGDKSIKGKEEKIPFDTFWDIYPRHEDKQKARVLWEKLALSDQSAVLENVAKRKESPPYSERGSRFILQPTTYLRNRRWEDELPANVPNMSSLKLGKAKTHDSYN